MKDLQVFVTINAQDNYSQAFKQYKQTTQEGQRSTNEFGKSVDNLGQKVKNSSKTQTQHHKTGVDKQIKNNNRLQNSYSGVASKLKALAITYLGFSAMKKAFTDFAYQEKFVGKTQAILHASKEDMQQYTKDLQELSKNSVNSMQDFFEAGFVGAKAGFSAKELPEFLKVVDDIQTAVSTTDSEDLKSVAEQFGIIAKTFKNQSVKELGDQYAYLIDTTANLNLNEMSMGFQKLNLFAGKTGANFAGLGASLATLIKAGQSGAVASTQIKSVFKGFERSGGGDVIAKKLGLKQATLEGDGFVTFIGDLKTKMDDMSKGQQQVFGKTLEKMFGPEGALLIKQLIANYDEILKKTEQLNKAGGFAGGAADINRNNAYGSLKQIGNAFSLLNVSFGKFLNTVDKTLGLFKIMAGVVNGIAGVFDGITSALEGKTTNKGVQEVAGSNEGDLEEDLYTKYKLKGYNRLTDEEKAKISPVIQKENQEKAQFTIKQIEAELNYKKQTAGADGLSQEQETYYAIKLAEVQQNLKNVEKASSEQKISIDVNSHITNATNQKLDIKTEAKYPKATKGAKQQL